MPDPKDASVGKTGLPTIEQLVFWRETLGHDDSWDERSERRWLLGDLVRAAWQYVEQTNTR